MMFNRTYFAHPVTDYGTTFERELLDILNETFNVIENPNQPIHDEGYKLDGMDYFMEKVLPQCDSCVFVAFPGGDIGAGVIKEIIYFISRNMPVFEFDVKTRELVQYTATHFAENNRGLEVPETRVVVRALRSVVNGGRGPLVPKAIEVRQFPLSKDGKAAIKSAFGLRISLADK